MKNWIKKYWKSITIFILLFLLVWFVAVPKYNLWQQTKGFEIGYGQAIIDIMQQVSTCQQVPLTFNNQTLNIIATGCLQNG